MVVLLQLLQLFNIELSFYQYEIVKLMMHILTTEICILHGDGIYIIFLVCYSSDYK